MKLRGAVRIVPVHLPRSAAPVARRLVAMGWPLAAVRGGLKMSRFALSRALASRDDTARVFGNFGRLA